MHRKPRWVAANPVLTAQMARRVSRHRTSQPLRANNPGWVRRSPCADAVIAQIDATAGGGDTNRIGLRYSLRGGRVSEATLLQLRRVLADTVLFEQAAEMPAFGSAYPCGSGYVAIGLLEQARQVAALELYDRLAFGALVIQGGPGGCHVAGPPSAPWKGMGCRFACLRTAGMLEERDSQVRECCPARHSVQTRPVLRDRAASPACRNARCRP